MLVHLVAAGEELAGSSRAPMAIASETPIDDQIE